MSVGIAEGWFENKKQRRRTEMKRNQQLREEVEKNRKHTPCWSWLLDYFYKRQVKKILKLPKIL